VVHKSNERLKTDLEVIVRHKVPVVVTSLGAVTEVIQAIQSYGGVVFHDAISIKYAEKAIAAGVNGVIAVATGAGGHGGLLNPFPFVHELRQLSDKAVILAGSISTGRQVAAAIVAGADLVSVGTRFIAVQEASVSDAYKQMIVASVADDIIYTPKFSGINANFMKQSILNAGIDLQTQEAPRGVDYGGDPKTSVWRDIWSAGQGVGAITSIPTMADLVAIMRDEFYQVIKETAKRYSRVA
jgi:nitronate monooxygenase